MTQQSLSDARQTLSKEHLMALSRLNAIKKKPILFDRGYPCADLIAALQASHCDFLLRVRSKFSIALDALDMGVHPFDFPCDDGSTIPLVAVKLALDSGETELLLTSIQDKRMGAKAFKELYFARWGVEVRINDLKHKVEIENFFGRLENNLYQDFYASVQLLNLVAVAAGEAQEIIDYSSDDMSKHCYKTNVNHAIGVYKDAFIAVVLEPDSVKCIWRLCKIVQLLAKGKTPVRPNRSVPRNPHPRNANFHHNRKSNA